MYNLFFVCALLTNYCGAFTNLTTSIFARLFAFYSLLLVFVGDTWFPISRDKEIFELITAFQIVIIINSSLDGKLRMLRKCVTGK